MTEQIQYEIKRAHRRTSFRVNARWNEVSHWLQSPVFRVVGTLPIIGYFILYSEPFENWFGLTALGDDLFLNGSLRLRLVYYGGLLMLISLALNQAFGPRIVRRFRYEDDYIEHVLKNMRSAWFVDAIVELRALVKHRNGMALRNDETRGDVETAINAAVLEVVASSSRNGVKLNALVAQEQMFDAPKEEFDQKLGEFFTYWNLHIRERGFPIACADMLRVHYASVNLYQSALVRTLIILLSGIGCLLVAIPAVETCLRIVLMDLVPQASRS